MEAARLHPRLATSWAELGTALGRAGKIPEAVQAFEKAVNLEPQNPSLLARLAFAEHAAGRITDAARDLLRSAEKSGAAFAHSAALGVLLYDSGRRQEARRWLEASRSEDPDFAEARYRIALLEAEAGDPEAARRALAQAIAASPGVRARAQNEPRLAGLTPRQ
jgi:tetratricopeptide (TPR) repeat protein